SPTTAKMPASLISRRLPNLPLRSRNASRVAAIAITSSSAAAITRLTQNSQTKLRSNKSRSLVIDSMKAITSAAPITASVEMNNAQRSALLMPPSDSVASWRGKRSSARRLDQRIVELQHARDAERPFAAEPDLQGLRQLRGIEPVAEFDVVARSAVELRRLGQLPAADARDHRHRLRQRGVVLAERAQADAPTAGERLERQPVAALDARHALVTPVPTRAVQGGFDLEIHRHAAAQGILDRARQRQAGIEFQRQRPIGRPQLQRGQLNALSPRIVRNAQSPHQAHRHGQ